MGGRVLKLNKLTFFVLALAGLLIASTTTLFLPHRFFLDTNILILDRYNEIGFVGSYPLTILFYKITGLRYVHFAFIGFLQYSIFMIVLYKIGIPERFHIINIKNVLIYFMFAVIAIYISMPSKEFINYLFIAALVFLFKNASYKLSKKVTIAILMLVTYAFFFRPYYAFISVLIVVMYYVSRLRIENKRVLAISTSLIVLIFISLSYGALKGVFLSEKTRYYVNSERLGSENANSMILSPVKPDTWYGESIGIVYGFLSVNLPFNGLKYLKSPHIMVFIVWQFLVFFILFKRFGRCLDKGRYKNEELWLFFILFSFFVVQGIFEPDLGSATRHKAGIFPLLYYLFYYEDFRKKLR
ncbi:hypothetical protein [Neptunitalea lumnitzerae]|uniref:Uncharacterized protein n=1 Tax=Neptunitalea lumnitzerae TaxID=2965509 RepID=A0ABQ5MFE5_9FLAO|nr:hypothetical protein [Neptunitalea sp. Y10]GLB48135.1 hypothetical protein Y10_05030 [Neptunitalea sp. Y10]